MRTLMPLANVCGCIGLAGALVGCLGFGGPPASEIEAAASANSPFAGKPAPDFELQGYDRATVSLSGLRGKWVVVYFYPKNDTPGCTCQATEFTKLLANFRGMNAEVIGISDDTPDSHRAFRDKHGLALHLLSDPDHTVMRAYGAWAEVESLLGSYRRVIRSTFIIDPEGIIRRHWPEVLPRGHARRVHEALAEMQAAAQE